jgi:hypothetical protein
LPQNSDLISHLAWASLGKSCASLIVDASHLRKKVVLQKLRKDLRLTGQGVADLLQLLDDPKMRFMHVSESNPLKT